GRRRRGGRRVTPAPPPLVEARAALVAASPIAVVDRSQPDRPQYLLRCARVSATHLLATARAGVFRFDGHAYDIRTAASYPVTFDFQPGRGVAEFRGPAPSGFQPGLPLRGIFYYDWFPEGWSQENGIFPFSKYHPTLGWYDSGDPKIVRRHVQAILYAHLPVGLFDWWGIGTNQDRRLPTAL